MCTLVILLRPGHDWPLIAAANRDEMKDRPCKPPSRHWPDRPGIIGGIDLLAGGAWLGINDHGVFAAMLNRQGSLGPEAGFRSRGLLTLEALGHESAFAAAKAMANIDPASYRPFNLVIAGGALAFCAISKDGEVKVDKLPPGLSMITAHERNDESSPRIRMYLPKFMEAKPPDPETNDWSSWTSLLASRQHSAGSGPEGAMNVVTDFGYGAVSSSLIALPASGDAFKPGGKKPILLHAEGPPGQAPYLPVSI